VTAGCARCASCCDPVPFTAAEHQAVSAWSGAAMKAAGIPGLRTDDGWAWWLDHGWNAAERDAAIGRTDLSGSWRQDADFIAAHWTPDGDSGCKCDAFDPATGLCGAHDSRPPVCRNYPWYSDGPGAERAASLPSHCSYLADVPRAERPEGSRPLIPLTVIAR
jgi:hypothetical protein